MEAWLLNLRYLGPLREDPRVLYKTAQGNPATPLGIKGELTAPTVDRLKTRRVLCPKKQVDGPPEDITLADALDYWLPRLGVAESVVTSPVVRMGVEMRVRDAGVQKDLDLMNVGVGVSQVLPVVVLCLLADPGSVVLLEQPELHLHPAVQQRLGDFLLALAQSGRQLIVETHSEYLVSRLRLRLAQDQSDTLTNWISVVFAERDEGETQFRTLQFDRYGGISDDVWPAGFFDQSAREYQDLITAALEKRRNTSE
jgi:predicted ATPase